MTGASGSQHDLLSFGTHKRLLERLKWRQVGVRRESKFSYAVPEVVLRLERSRTIGMLLFRMRAGG
jgi:hypothetical protein